jgi:hypothetical protein
VLNLLYIGLCNYLFVTSPKVQATEGKIHNWHNIKLKSGYTVTETIKNYDKATYI